MCMLCAHEQGSPALQHVERDGDTHSAKQEGCQSEYTPPPSWLSMMPNTSVLPTFLPFFESSFPTWNLPHVIITPPSIDAIAHTVRSSLAEATNRPFGVNLTALISSSWPGKPMSVCPRLAERVCRKRRDRSLACSLRRLACIVRPSKDAGAGSTEKGEVGSSCGTARTLWIGKKGLAEAYRCCVAYVLVA